MHFGTKHGARQGNMQNLTANETSECGLCLHSPIFVPATLSYLLISVPANGWVLWLMVSSPVFWTDRMEVLEFHLVLSEVVYEFLQTLMSTNFHVYPAAALILSKSINVMLAARLQFQCAICIERYLAVVQPVLYLRYKPLRYRMSFCCALWLLTIVVAVVQILLCEDNPILIGIYTIFFALLFTINSFCCLAVLRALKQPSPGEGEREGSNLMKKRAFNIVLIFQVTLIVSYLPLIIMYLLIGKIDHQTLCIWQPLAYCVMIWLGVIYPLLYIHRAGKHQVRNYLCVHCFKK